MSTSVNLLVLLFSFKCINCCRFLNGISRHQPDFKSVSPALLADGGYCSHSAKISPQPISRTAPRPALRRGLICSVLIPQVVSRFLCKCSEKCALYPPCQMLSEGTKLQQCTRRLLAQSNWLGVFRSKNIHKKYHIEYLDTCMEY